MSAEAEPCRTTGTLGSFVITSGFSQSEPGLGELREMLVDSSVENASVFSADNGYISVLQV